MASHIPIPILLTYLGVLSVCIRPFAAAPPWAVWSVTGCCGGRTALCWQQEPGVELTWRGCPRCQNEQCWGFFFPWSINLSLSPVILFMFLLEDLSFVCVFVCGKLPPSLCSGRGVVGQAVLLPRAGCSVPRLLTQPGPQPQCSSPGTSTAGTFHLFRHSSQHLAGWAVVTLPDLSALQLFLIFTDVVLAYIVVVSPPFP